MRRRLSLLLGLGVCLTALAACTNIPLAPTWNADFYLPIQFADVTLGGAGGVAPGGIIPPANVTSTSPADSQEIGGATQQILDENRNSLKADIILANPADLNGHILN